MVELAKRYRAVARLPAGRASARLEAQASEAPADPSGSVATGDLWRILRARRKSLLIVALVVALAGSGYSLLARPLSTAVAQILIDPRDHQVVDRSLTADAPSPDSGATQVETQARLVESDAVLLRAIDMLDLVHDPDFGPAPAGLFARLRAAAMPGEAASVAPLDRGTAMAETLRALRRRLAVRRGDKTLVIDIVVTAHSPENAARIAGAIADAYVADVSAARERAARIAAAALTSRLEALHDRTRAAETALEAYKASAGFVGPNGLPVIDAQLTAANADLSSAQARAEAAQARLDQVTAMQRDGLLATSASAPSTVLSQLRTGVAAQAETLSRLQVAYGPRHPAVLAARAQLSHAQAEVQAEVVRTSKIAQADADRARAEVIGAQARLDDLKGQSATVNARSVGLRELQREVDSDRSVYQSFLTRSEELSAQAGVDIANLRIISRPLPPLQASWPPRGLIVAASVVAGLALGTFWALMREYMRPSVLSRADLKFSSGAGLVGSVSARALRQVQPTAAHMVDLRDIATAATLQRMLRQHARPAQSGQPRCISVISLPQERQERSRFATLMAATAARQGLRVVVIGTETDGPAPELSFRSALPIAGPGAAAPSGTPGQVMRLSAGTGDMLTIPDAKELLAALGKEFDIVIADLEDLVGSAESTALAAASDDVVVVACEGQTERVAIEQLADLAEAGGGGGVTAAVLVGDPGRV